MQRNQSFFAPAPHLYIYDNLLSSGAKVRLICDITKLLKLEVHFLLCNDCCATEYCMLGFLTASGISTRWKPIQE